MAEPQEPRERVAQEAGWLRVVKQFLTGHASRTADAATNGDAPETPPDGFWTRERDTGQRALTPLMLATTTAGVKQGAASITLTSNLKLENREAADWARREAATLVKGITDTSRKRTADAIADWTGSDRPLSALRDQITETIGNKRRAELIAITESTRAFAEGNRIAWAAGGIDDDEWQTAADEGVCPICGPLRGKHRAERGGRTPPAHPGCRCWLTPLAGRSAAPPPTPPPPPQPPRPARRPQPKPKPKPAPVVEPEGGLPRGAIPVSGALDISGVGRTHGAKASAAVRAIDAVHGDGELPRIPVEPETTRKRLGGFFFVPGLPIAKRITVKGDDLAFTLVHEVGHFLDHQVLGAPRGRFGSLFATQADNEMHAWQQAVNESRHLRALRLSRDTGVAHSAATLEPVTVKGIIDTEPRPWRTQQAFVRYQLTPEEVWARSYAQYIAEESADPRLLAGLRQGQADPVYGGQWDTADFAPIRAAIKALFQAKGWQR